MLLITDQVKMQLDKHIFPSDIAELSAASDFDLLDGSGNPNPNNVLYRFNSVEGGVVVPRGTSIVGMDLRKTKTSSSLYS